jgi:microcystin-dependent protein
MREGVVQKKNSFVSMGSFLGGMAFACAFVIGLRAGHADPPATFSAGETLSAAKMNNAFASLDARLAEVEKRPLTTGSVVPPGTIVAFGGEIVPEGWLLCDGSSLSRAQYAPLFAAIKSSWGEGDGQTTFNVPDLRGVFLRGVAHKSGRDPNRDERTADKPGSAKGDAVGSFQGDQVKNHGHQSVYPNFVAVGVAGGGAIINYAAGATTVATQGTAPNGAETRPINAYVNYIIKL